jgi:hypothetical protein
MRQKKTAKIIKKFQGPKGPMWLVKVKPPIIYEDKKITDFIIVSAISCASDTLEPETYVFPSDENGTVLDWLELDGSFRGDMDHKRAIESAGYKIIK